MNLLALNIPWEMLAGRGAGSAIVIIVALTFYALAMRAVRLAHSKNRFSLHRVTFIEKVFRICGYVGALLGLVVIWGFEVENLWILISSVLGLVAIGFFAVWSILSNIVTGVLLYFTNPFRIGEYVEIPADSIGGTVEDITTMFVVLKDTDGATLQIPNNLFFQRILRVRSSPPPKTEENTLSEDIKLESD